MILKNLSVREQIVKTVVKSGNGGAVWVPKGWLGQEVIVILPQKPKLEIREKIIHLLEPYLKDIISVFIYGSHARHEETKDSDIDLMVITEKPVKINIKEPKLEITSFELEKFKRAIEKYPVMYYQMVQEAEPLINSNILEELKEIKINKENFKDYLDETKEHIKSNKELIELDKLDFKYVGSYSAIYSIILRLRGIFITRCILEKNKFSNKEFKKWLIKQGASNDEFERIYSVYRAVRDNKKVKINIKIPVAEKLLNILEKELRHIEDKLNG
ncbi:MAG: DUF2080 family transposase-associated protein [Nanoarchaeota archaeon]